MSDFNVENPGTNSPINTRSRTKKQTPLDVEIPEKKSSRQGRKRPRTPPPKKTLAKTVHKKKSTFGHDLRANTSNKALRQQNENLRKERLGNFQKNWRSVLEKILVEDSDKNVGSDSDESTEN